MEKTATTTKIPLQTQFSTCIFSAGVFLGLSLKKDTASSSEPSILSLSCLLLSHNTTHDEIIENWILQDGEDNNNKIPFQTYFSTCMFSAGVFLGL
jgi:hypothetical protein